MNALGLFGGKNYYGVLLLWDNMQLSQVSVTAEPKQKRKKNLKAPLRSSALSSARCNYYFSPFSMLKKLLWGWSHYENIIMLQDFQN